MALIETPFCGAKCLRGTWNILSWREGRVNGVIGFFRPAEERDFVSAFLKNLDSPVAAELLFVSTLGSTDHALVPRRAGVQPVVGSHGDFRMIGVAELDLGCLCKGCLSRY